MTINPKAFRLTAARVYEKALAADNAGRIIGVKESGSIDSLNTRRYRQPRREGYRYSMIGAAIPERLMEWIEKNGKGAEPLENLYVQGHIYLPQPDRRLLLALDEIEALRMLACAHGDVRQFAYYRAACSLVGVGAYDVEKETA